MDFIAVHSKGGSFAYERQDASFVDFLETLYIGAAKPFRASFGGSERGRRSYC
jgi:hypothetical protein